MLLLKLNYLVTTNSGSDVNRQPDSLQHCLEKRLETENEGTNRKQSSKKELNFFSAEESKVSSGYRLRC